MKCNKEMLLLYAVTDRTWTGEQTLYEQVKEALKGGATCIQLREKELDMDTFLQEAFKIKKLCKQYHVPLIINDNVEIAIKCGADGIHVGQDDMDIEKVRKLVGDNMIIGASASNLAQALKAEKKGADYLGVGAMFKTNTKTDAASVSLTALTEIAKAVKIPVCAIGGINLNNMHLFKNCQINGFAIVSEIFAAKDIKKSTISLKAKALDVLNNNMHTF